MTDELPELPRPVQNLIDEGFRRHIERKIARDAAQAKKARDENEFLTKLVALTLELLPEAIRPYTQFHRLVDQSLSNFVHHDAEFIIAIPGAARIILRVETVKQWLENGPKADELQSVGLFDDSRYGTEGLPFKIINYRSYFDEDDGIYIIGDMEIGNTRKTTSLSSSTRMPPMPNMITGPNWGSRFMPMMTSSPLPIICSI